MLVASSRQSPSVARESAVRKTVDAGTRGGAVSVGDARAEGGGAYLEFEGEGVR